MQTSPTPNSVALARHVPTSRVGRYDEETCDGKDARGERTITLLNILDPGEMGTFPSRDVEIITYEDDDEC